LLKSKGDKSVINFATKLRNYKKIANKKRRKFGLFETMSNEFEEDSLQREGSHLLIRLGKYMDSAKGKRGSLSPMKKGVTLNGKESEKCLALKFKQAL